MSVAALLWCPFPDEDTARAAVTALRAERLIACGNLLPGMLSLFAWRGEAGEARECGVLLKTRAALRAAVMRRLAELHPYDTPAILSWPVEADAATLDWLEEETGAA